MPVGRIATVASWRAPSTPRLPPRTGEQSNWGSWPGPEYVYSEALRTDPFDGVEIERIKSYDTAIDGGVGHDGPSARIGLSATKR